MTHPCNGTVKLAALVPVPPGPTTLICPVVAADGTMAVIWVSESTEKLAVVPANRTSVASVKCDPSIVTDVPGGPDAGVKPLIDGEESVPGTCSSQPRSGAAPM